MYLPAWPGLGWREVAGPPRPDLPFPLRAPAVTAFHTARNAIYHLFVELVRSGRRVVLAPDYHMGNEVRAMRAAGAQIVWYPVDRYFQIDLERLRRLCRQHGPSVLFVIHYAGWPQPMEALSRLCAEKDLVLVEDCALALFSEHGGRPVGSFGDYAIFCLYKTLPLPDGGLLVQNRRVFSRLLRMPLRPSGRTFVAGRMAELTLERIRSRHPAVGRRLAGAKAAIGGLLNAMRVERVPVGDTGFNVAHADLGMAAVSHAIAARCDANRIRQRRRENFLALRHAFIEEAAVRGDLPSGMCPLFFPLLVAHKHDAARALWRRGVMATELWNDGDDSVRGQDGEDARFLRRHVLELPIHQDITPGQIERMAGVVRELNIVLPFAAARRECQPA